jgi:hypothetical protein
LLSLRLVSEWFGTIQQEYHFRQIKKEAMMGKKISVILAIFVAAMFSSQSFAAGHKFVKNPEITIKDIAGVWHVTVKELLIVDEIGIKKATNATEIEFIDGEAKDSFILDNPDGILGFEAECSIARRSAKIVWNINEIDTFEESLGVAIGAWIEENVKNMIGKPILDIRSYAYLPIVVIKNTASPKLGILQVKGTMAMTIEDGNGGKITEVKNFKYQCKFNEI